MENILIIGASGHAKVIIDCVGKEGKYRIAGLADDAIPEGTSLLSCTVLGRIADIPSLAEKHNIHGCIIAIGDNHTRKTVAQKIALIMPGLLFCTAVHPSAQIAADVTIGAGTVIFAGVAINAGSKTGMHCILNTHASLDHDSVMEDFASLAPSAATGGNVHIGACSAISLGAHILHGVRIGKDTVIGAGALVLENMPDKVLAYGSPARVIRTRAADEKYL